MLTDPPHRCHKGNEPLTLDDQEAMWTMYMATFNNVPHTDIILYDINMQLFANTNTVGHFVGSTKQESKRGSQTLED